MLLFYGNGYFLCDEGISIIKFLYCLEKSNTVVPVLRDHSDERHLMFKTM